MHKKDGFMLLEVIIMVALELIIAFVLTVAGMQIMKYRAVIQATDELQNLTVIAMLCARDIRYAPKDFLNWNSLKQDHISWRQSNGHTISWYYKRNRLYRSELGVSVVVGDIDEVLFSSDCEKGFVRAIFCKMRKNRRQVELYVPCYEYILRCN